MSKAPNPGSPEWISFWNPGGNEYNYFFAVATNADTASDGTYTVDVKLTTAPGSPCPESLPGASYSDWPSNVGLIAVDGNGHGEATGDVADGSCVDLQWAANSTTACFPGTQFEHFLGNHRYYALEEPLPPNSVVTVTLTPDSGVDVNLYGYQVGQQTVMVPPNVPSVVTCEASYPQSLNDDPNPGAVETISFQNPHPTASYNIFLAVAGNGSTGTSGGYTIEVDVVTATTFCEESLPGITAPSAWPGSVTTVSLDGSGLGTAQCSRATTCTTRSIARCRATPR